MARRKHKSGTCHICGKYGKLSPEHVPPQSAFNNARIVEYTLESWLAKESNPKSRIQQGGIKRHTLCTKCNPDTGSWYGAEYVSWAKTCMSFLYQIPDNISEIGIVLQNVYPLRFLKQVVTCFFSIFPDAGFAQANPALVGFVLNKEENNLPSESQFYLSLYQGPKLRQNPLSGLLNPFTGEMSVFSEIAHPPFALVMTQGSEFQRGLDITHFKEYKYDEQTDLVLRLKVGEGHTPYPGDYHTKRNMPM